MSDTLSLRLGLLLAVVDVKHDGRHVADVLVEAAVVVLVDSFGGGDLHGVDGPPGSGGWMTSVLYSPLMLSVSAS